MAGNTKNTRKFIVGIVIAILITLFVGWCWSIRETKDTRRATRKEVSKRFRQAKPDEVLPFLEKLFTQRVFHTWFNGDFPWLHLAWETKVPYDYIGQLTEESIIRFAGNGQDGSEDVAHLKPLVAFAGELVPRCETAEAAHALRDRRLDGFFLMKDYDGAIALVESGLPNHSPIWCKGTVAKLRAHKALAAGDKKTAAKNFLIFGEFLASDEMKDFEDCDPTTGIVYSIEWVVARNYMRVSKLLAETGDKTSAKAYLDKAKPEFTKALEKAKEDTKSLEALKAEVKAAGL